MITIISDSYATKQRKSSSKLLNPEKNGGQRNWFRKQSRISPAASTNPIRPFSYGLCESRIDPVLFVLACFEELLFSNS